MSAPRPFRGMTEQGRFACLVVGLALVVVSWLVFAAGP